MKDVHEKKRKVRINTQNIKHVKSKYQSYLRINTLLTDTTHENGNVVLIFLFHD
jgi:hypothetical protein